MGEQSGAGGCWAGAASGHRALQRTPCQHRALPLGCRVPLWPRRPQAWGRERPRSVTKWLRGPPQPRPRGVFHPRSAVIAGGAAERPGENNGAARPGPLPGTMAQRSLSSSPPESPRGRGGRGTRGCATKALSLPERPRSHPAQNGPDSPGVPGSPRVSALRCLEGPGVRGHLLPQPLCVPPRVAGHCLRAGARRGQRGVRQNPAVPAPSSRGFAGSDPDPRPILRGESGPDFRATPALPPPRAPQPLRDRSRGSHRSDLGPSPLQRRAEAAPSREAELRRHRGQRWDRTPPHTAPPRRTEPDPRRERSLPVHREPGGHRRDISLHSSLPLSLPPSGSRCGRAEAAGGAGAGPGRSLPPASSTLGGAG